MKLVEKKNMQMFIFILSSMSTTYSINLSPGAQVPHADQLNRILKKHVNFTAPQDGSILDYLFKGSARKNSLTSDWDIKILDAEGVKKITKMAWEQYQNENVENLLLSEWLPTISEHERANIDNIEKNYRRVYNNHFGYQQLDVMANIAIRIMKQSLYSAKERIASTEPLRKKFMNDLMYQIAIKISMVNQMVLRMDAYWQTMEKWSRNHQIPTNGRRVHFLWYLIFYERHLSCNVDVTNTVKQIFKLHKSAQKQNKED